MEQLVDTLTFGNPQAVKAVVASVAAALAVYQLVLIAIAYGKLRPGALSAPVASFTHRASGDAILVLVVLVALACLARFGLDDDGAVHAVSGAGAPRRARAQARRAALVARPRALPPAARLVRVRAARGDLVHVGRALPGRGRVAMPSRGRQLAGSLLVALAIVAVAIVLVVAKLGPDSGDDDGGKGGDRDKVEQRQSEDDR
jgi:hypothetical protein